LVQDIDLCLAPGCGRGAHRRLVDLSEELTLEITNEGYAYFVDIFNAAGFLLGSVGEPGRRERHRTRK
jgi:hypothetical protein